MAIGTSAAGDYFCSLGFEVPHCRFEDESASLSFDRSGRTTRLRIQITSAACKRAGLEDVF